MKTFERYPMMTLAHLQQCSTNRFAQLRVEYITAGRTLEKVAGRESIAGSGDCASHTFFNRRRHERRRTGS